MGILVHCWWECTLVHSPCKTVWRFLQKLKIELQYDPEIPLLVIYPKKMKMLIRKYMCTPMFIYNNQGMETTSVPINR